MTRPGFVIPDRSDSTDGPGYGEIHTDYCPRLREQGAHGSWDTRRYATWHAAQAASQWQRLWTVQVPVRACICVVTLDERDAYREQVLRAYQPGVQVRYHGSLAAHHGLYRLVGRCYCDECEDGYDCRCWVTGDEPCPDHVRWVATNGYRNLEHVRTESLTLVTAETPAA
jgi:hypothetical protein